VGAEEEALDEAVGVEEGEAVEEAFHVEEAADEAVGADEVVAGAEEEDVDVEKAQSSTSIGTMDASLSRKVVMKI